MRARGRGGVDVKNEGEEAVVGEKRLGGNSASGEEGHGEPAEEAESGEQGAEMGKKELSLGLGLPSEYVSPRSLTGSMISNSQRVWGCVGWEGM